MKICTKCKIKKDLTEFGKMSSVKNGLRPDCKSCRKIESKIRYKEKNQEIIKYQKNYVERNKEKVLKNKRQYYWKDPERFKQYQKDNRDRIRITENNRNRLNPEKVNFKAANRRAIKLLATPKWLTKDHLELIKMKYQLAAYLSKVTGIPHVVDHIIPLINKNIQGLHVPWNLRVIPAYENGSKGNKF